MYKRESLGVIIGAVCTAALLITIFHNSRVYLQYQEIKSLKEQCEATLNVDEECVVVAIPTSKD